MAFKAISYFKRLQKGTKFNSKGAKIAIYFEMRDHVTSSYLKLQILKLNHLYLNEAA